MDLTTLLCVDTAINAVTLLVLLLAISHLSDGL